MIEGLLFYLTFSDLGYCFTLVTTDLLQLLLFRSTWFLALYIKYKVGVVGLSVIERINYSSKLTFRPFRSSGNSFRSRPSNEDVVVAAEVCIIVVVIVILGLAMVAVVVVMG